MITSLCILFRQKGILIAYPLLVLLAFWIWRQYTDIGGSLGNYGALHTYTDITLSVVMILGFPLFFLGILYRSWYFGKKDSLTGKTGLGMLSGIFGTILSGCSCCGVTIASTLGLLPLLSFLPWSGLEIKIVATLGLFYALWDLLAHLQSCQLRQKG